MAKGSEVFSAEYYGKYYGSARTRVHGAKEIARLCAAVTSMLDWWGVPLDTVLDVGAGVGLWRDWFKKNRPKTVYRSTEVSRYACAQYGHEQRDITKWRADTAFDLVVCQGVLPYLDDAGCARAIDNLGAMTAGLLYLEAITKKDVQEVIDDSKTDVKVHERTGAWYRSRLRAHYTELGCGLWAKHDAPVLFYELERR
ncbi:MAG: Methyltransferase type 12 [Myxococcaceae bacterium]|nr:Methyltransferase type 12 [Myxococcaceae bacterium]